jgi:hypothetical protein
MMSNNRALEKANEAYGRAIEANSVAKATARQDYRYSHKCKRRNETTTKGNGKPIE